MISRKVRCPQLSDTGRPTCGGASAVWNAGVPEADPLRRRGKRDAEPLGGLFRGEQGDRSLDVDIEGRTYRVDKIMQVDDYSTPTVALWFEDVTRQREAEQAKSDFTAQIVHDLRGPLSGIQGTLEFVLSQEGNKLDALYTDLHSARMPRREELEGALKVWHRARVLCNDMESSTIFVICALRNLRGGSVLTVVNEPGEEAIDPARVAALDLTPMFRVALGAARSLAPLKA